MNFFKGIVTRSKNRNNEENAAQQRERSLCIQHLRKLFLEFVHPTTPLSQEQRELKQYLMLPLFIKAFGNLPNLTNLSDKFADVLQFAGHTSKLIVSEVQRRAANKPNTQASKDILVFLCQHNNEIDNKGWNLMQALLILTSGELAVIECMVAATLQSILVKCIRLFFSLPSNFSSHEKCVEVQKVLVPILVKLCNYPITAKELIRTDDLAKLFVALTCSSKSEHLIWRSGVSEVLTTITRYCFTNEIIDYIHNKSCIALSLANIESVCEAEPLAVVEMFVTLMCVLKDSADVSSALMDSFYKAHGYKFLVRILLNFSTRNDEPAMEASRNLVLLVASLVTTGHTVISPSHIISTPFQKDRYSIPEPSNSNGVGIRNLEAFEVLVRVFLECKSDTLSLYILHSTQSLLNSDNANYFIIEPMHPFAKFIQKIPEKGADVKTGIMKLVEFIALQLNWVPTEELIAMTILFKEHQGIDMRESQCAVLNTLILLTNHNVKYKSVLREAGLIDVMITALKKYSTELKDSQKDNDNDLDDSSSDYLFLLMECLRLLIENSKPNTELFRQYGGSRCVHNIIPFKSARSYALRIVQQLIVDGGDDDLGTLLGLMHSTQTVDLKLKTDVLASLLRIFAINPLTRSVFQEVGGFVYVVSVLVSLEGSLATPPAQLWKDSGFFVASRDDILQLIWMVFNVLTSAMKDESVNKMIFMDKVRFRGLIGTVKLLGCFSHNNGILSSVEEVTMSPLYLESKEQDFTQLVICKAFLSMATGVFESWDVNFNFEKPNREKVPKIYHPTAVNGLVELLPFLNSQLKNNDDVLVYVINEIQHLMASQVNQQLMCDTGLPYLLLEKCKVAFLQDHHPLNSTLTKLFERLASQSLHPEVLRTFLRLGSPLNSQSAYAILRGYMKRTNNTLTSDKDVVDCQTTLQLCNGGIILSCKEQGSNSYEENEFQTFEDGQVSAAQSNDHLQEESDEKRESNEVVFSDEENKHNCQFEMEQRSPIQSHLRKGSAIGYSLNEEDVVDRVQNLFENQEDSSQINCTFMQELTRPCDSLEGKPLPQNLVKSVVSLTTPRDVLSTAPVEPPAFIEFDMNEDGYACLFIPALTPQIVQVSSAQLYRKSSTQSPVTAQLATSSVERVFPPPTGISVSVWLYLDRVPTASSGSYVNLFTVEKQFEEVATKRLVSVNILQIYLDLKNLTLVLNTDIGCERVTKSNTLVQVHCTKLFELQTWNHICVNLHRNLMRTSTTSVYVNAKNVLNSKVKYIYQGLPSGADINTCKTVAYIGTHPHHCHISDLVWRLGPLALFEESLAEDSINSIYSLGPSYIGCFQTSSFVSEEDDSECKSTSIVAEERILLCVNPHNCTLTTLLKLSATTSKAELEVLASEMNISREDKHSPIHLIPNAALHLNGAARPIGLFFIGVSGIRVFCPNSVASAFISIGGSSILLCLVAMVTELSELYASLKALTCILQSSRVAKREMSRIHGYKILAFLLQKKKHLLNTHILHLVFSLVGTVRSDRDSATIPNLTAFNDILCNLEVWHNTPADLEKSLFLHFYELISQGSEQQHNISYFHKLGCVTKFIHMVQEGYISESTLHVVANVISVLLENNNDNSDLLVFGQYLASTLPSSSAEKNVNLNISYDKKNTNTSELQKAVNQRNVFLDVLIRLLQPTSVEKQPALFSKQLCQTLGFDWMLLFLDQNVHNSSVLRGAQILFKILNDPTAFTNFQNGSMTGFWLKGCDDITTKKTNTAAGFSVSANAPSDHEINHSSYKQKGVPILTNLLEEHAKMNEIYYLLFNLLFNIDDSGVEAFWSKLSFDTLHLIYWSETNNKLCLDAILILLHLVRKVMSEESLECDIPSVVIKFIDSLYKSTPHITKLTNFCTTPVFLTPLISVLFPMEKEKDLLDFNIEVTDNQLDGGVPIPMTTLAAHPDKTLVFDLLKEIFLDQALNSKLNVFVETVWLSLPTYASFSQKQTFFTMFICSVINDFFSPSVINDADCKASRYYNNGVFFVGNVVDKLWLGFFSESYKIIFQFITSLLSKVEDDAGQTELLFHSLNRVLLYQFSKPGQQVTDQSNLLELLHLLTSYSKLIFSVSNSNPEFITCLTYWLLVVGNASHRKPSPASSLDLNLSDEDNSDNDSSQNMALESLPENSKLAKLVRDASERAWNVFFSHRKDLIEEIFGLQSSFVSYEATSFPSSRPNTMSIQAAHQLLGEQATRCWINYIGNEQKKRNEYLANPSPYQFIKKSTKWKSLKKEKVTEDYYSVQETLSWLGVHLRAVKALVKLRNTKLLQEFVLRGNFAEKNWSLMELDLIREGSIWGPKNANQLEKWMIDDIEGPCRMRKSLTTNDMFYIHYPYVEEDKELLVSKHRLPYSHDSKMLYQLCQKYMADDERPIPTKDNPFTWRPKLYSVDGFEAEDSKEEVNTQTIVQLLEAGEKLFSIYRCARVSGLDSAEGLFLFGRNHFYVIDGFTLMSSDQTKNSHQAKEIKDINSLPPGSHEPLIPAAKGNFILKRSLSKWAFSDIKEVHKRRYLLQNIAIEVFANDGNNHLLVFPKETARDKVYSRIRRVSPEANIEESIAGMSSEGNLESGQGLLSNLLTGDRSVTLRWVRGEISNFQYLTFVNTLAGRSYNDLMQYPIMPWIIADYTSEVLDLTNSAVFRDLSKPMGAQSSDRLTNYRKRYKEWEDPLGKTPAYYYGTHYSSAMIVASYLIRLEPFTQHFLRLQGGHFDLPDRLFHSIKDSWLSASQSNMADVKELIPEFFYLPDFLCNTNKFDLGTKQSGEELGDVILPPWAKGDAIEFIRVNREALECDYVSAHLHEWINLVFGYKQQGSAALESDNVFHHLFYEKSVDLDTITDPLERKATIGFINNFGQMPKQLFKKPHPAKRLPSTTLQQTGVLPVPHLNERMFFHSLTSLAPSVSPVKELKGSVGHIYILDRSIATVEANKIIFPESMHRLGWGYGDFSLRYFSSDNKLLSVFEGVFSGQTLCVSCLDVCTFVSGGSNATVCMWKVKQSAKSYALSLQKVLYGHQGDVLSLAVSKPYNIIVSGSEDGSCIVWNMQKLSYTRRLKMPSGGSISCITINNTTGDIITCAGTHLYVWTLNGQLLVEENTSAAISGQIICCAVSECNEWDESNVILTGAADGVVKIWGIRFCNSQANEDNDVSVQEVKFSSLDSDGSLKKADSKEYLMVQYPDSKKEKDWKRALVLRHRLTMHTAFCRSDNSEPASVTALAISKDHRKVYVGDSRGRIYSWSVSDTVGRKADHWVKDEVVEFCNNCETKFTFAERRHHCRNCGNVFCGRCSRYESPVVHLHIFKAVRVCVNCYNELKRKPPL